MIIIYIYYHIFMNLYILLVFFLLILHFELHYNVQVIQLLKPFHGQEKFFANLNQ